MTTINTQRLLAYAYVSNIEYGIDKISNGEWAFTSIWKLSSLIVLVNCGRNWPEDFVKENNVNCIQTALNYGPSWFCMFYNGILVYCPLILLFVGQIWLDLDSHSIWMKMLHTFLEAMQL